MDEHISVLWAFSLSLGITNILQARILFKESRTGDADIFRYSVQFFFLSNSALVIMVTYESKSSTITILVLMVRFKMAPSINCWNLDSVSDSSKYDTNAVS